MVPWIISDESFYLSAIFAWTGIIITGHLIYGHLKNYTCPSQVCRRVRLAPSPRAATMDSKNIIHGADILLLLVAEHQVLHAVDLL